MGKGEITERHTLLCSHTSLASCHGCTLLFVYKDFLKAILKSLGTVLFLFTVVGGKRGDYSA